MSEELEHVMDADYLDIESPNGKTINVRIGIGENQKVFTIPMDKIFLRLPFFDYGNILGRLTARTTFAELADRIAIPRIVDMDCYKDFDIKSYDDYLKYRLAKTQERAIKAVEEKDGEKA